MGNQYKEEYERRKAKHDGGQKDNYIRGWRRYFRWWKIPADRFAGMLVIVTLLLVWVGVLQWCTLQSTEAVLNKTDETNRIATRPYISAVALQIDTERFPTHWMFNFVVENSGGTPPMEMRYLVRSSAEPPSDPEDVFRNPGPTDSIWHGTIAPKSKITLPYGGSGIPKNFFAERKYWYISGVIHYRDRFTRTHERVSKFCFAAIPAVDYQTGGSRPAYDICKYWNCLDEDCKADRERYDRELKALNPQINAPK